MSNCLNLTPSNSAKTRKARTSSILSSIDPFDVSMLGVSLSSSPGYFTKEQSKNYLDQFQGGDPFKNLRNIGKQKLEEAEDEEINSDEADTVASRDEILEQDAMQKLYCDFIHDEEELETDHFAKFATGLQDLQCLKDCIEVKENKHTDEGNLLDFLHDLTPWKSRKEISEQHEKMNSVLSKLDFDSNEFIDNESQKSENEFDLGMQLRPRNLRSGEVDPGIDKSDKKSKSKAKKSDKSNVSEEIITPKKSSARRGRPKKSNKNDAGTDVVNRIRRLSIDGGSNAEGEHGDDVDMSTSVQMSSPMLKQKRRFTKKNEGEGEGDGVVGSTENSTIAKPPEVKTISIELKNEKYDNEVTEKSGQHSGRKGWIGAYSPEKRKEMIERYLAKRKSRTWTKKIKYEVRKSFADSRLRVKGRFISKTDEDQLREWVLCSM